MLKHFKMLQSYHFESVFEYMLLLQQLYVEFKSNLDMTTKTRSSLSLLYFFMKYYKI